MKKLNILTIGQYAYTLDGRVIRIQEILDNGERYRGFCLEENGCHKVELDCSEIYGVAFGLSRAV